MNPRIILFDMDGTLTEARKKANKNMAVSLKKLRKFGKIGILSGSGYEYMLEQCSIFWNDNHCKESDFILLPCNGTQMYNWDGEEWDLSYSQSLKDFLGNKDFDALVLEIINCHIRFTNENFGKYPLSGNFISYRKSLINWSPIGRDSGERERKLFVDIDSKENLRKNFLPTIKKSIKNEKIKISLGGNTSFDIYPKGWDKTHALKHFKTMECWFVGDRCEKYGNDKTIYDSLSRKKRAFKTTGPDHTLKIIEEMIEKFSGDNDAN